MAHRRLPPFLRKQILFVLDDCFINHGSDKTFLTVLVRHLYPSRAIFATPFDSKGPDAHCTARLASFVHACGVQQMSYTCDQEGAVRTCMQEALEVAKGRAEWISAVPENSPASNGRAERSVQRFEDQLRALLGQLESRIGRQRRATIPWYRGLWNVLLRFEQIPHEWRIE